MCVYLPKGLKKKKKKSRGDVTTIYRKWSLLLRQDLTVEPWPSWSTHKRLVLELKMCTTITSGCLCKPSMTHDGTWLYCNTSTQKQRQENWGKFKVSLTSKFLARQGWQWDRFKTYSKYMKITDSYLTIKEPYHSVHLDKCLFFQERPERMDRTSPPQGSIRQREVHTVGGHQPKARCETRPQLYHSGPGRHQH